MGKSSKTYELEEIITMATARSNRIGCAEVNFGVHGIVDFVNIELDGKHVLRCYELKISKSDFLSDSKKTFVGEYNYYVIPTELWSHVKNYVEPDVGVWCVDPSGRAFVKKKAKSKRASISKREALMKIMLALSRENLKHCEKSWEQRQMHKNVRGFDSKPIASGDTVSYKGRSWTIEHVMRKIEDGTTATMPFLLLKGDDGSLIETEARNVMLEERKR